MGMTIAENTPKIEEIQMEKGGGHFCQKER
jgi:hypothetical protein